MEVRKPPLQLGGAWRQHRRWVGREGLLGIGQDLPPVHFVRDAVCRHQHHGVRGGEPVLERRLEHQVLVFLRERGQGVRGGWPEAPPGQFGTGPRGQPGRELETAHDPVRPLAQQECDGACLDVVIGLKRRDHARFVERGHGAGWCVGHQHEPRVVDGRQRGLHDGGHGPASRVTPADEPLEAVQDLVVPIVGGHDADGPIGERRVGRREPSRPESGEAGADLFDGELADGPEPDAVRHGAPILAVRAFGRGSITLHACAPRTGRLRPGRQCSTRRWLELDSPSPGAGSSPSTARARA